MSPREPSPPAVTEALEPAERGHALVRRLRLSVDSGPDAGGELRSSGDRVVVGTHESADLVLTDSAVSRFHCQIDVSGATVTLRDLDSKNGTWLDGVSILAAHLHDGAVLAVGRSRITVRLGDADVRVALSARERFGVLSGRSAAMRSVFAVLEKAAPTDASVLLLGETGTGKDAAAYSLHLEGPRRDGPFVPVNVAALPSTLLESELFGHERGAFTGAERQRRGAFELASGGTLFLDELGELPLPLQPRLLRAIETREIRRLGGERSLPVDARIVAATNRDLRREVNAGRFRADLFYRLARWEITLPPLRERPQDLPVIVEALLAEIGAADAATVRRLTSARSLAELTRYAWPGNVRELRNYLERAVSLDEPGPPAGDGDALPVIDTSLPLRVIRERFVRHVERRYLEELLRAHGDNVSAAARAAGIDRVHLHRLLSRVGLR